MPPLEPANAPIVEPSNARSEAYRLHLQEILASGQCPFCPGGDTFRQQEIVWQGDGWWLSANAHSLPNTSLHVILVPQRHVLALEELSADELAGLTQALGQAQKHYGYPGIVWYWRQGDMMTTGATVAHLHLQGIVPQGIAQVYFGHPAGN